MTNIKSNINKLVLTPATGQTSRTFLPGNSPMLRPHFSLIVFESISKCETDLVSYNKSFGLERPLRTSWKAETENRSGLRTGNVRSICARLGMGGADWSRDGRVHSGERWGLMWMVLSVGSFRMMRRLNFDLSEILMVWELNLDRII